MLVVCEKCARRYRVDPSRIKGEKAWFKCKSCGEAIVVSRQEEVIPEAPSPGAPPPPVDEPPVSGVAEETPPRPRPFEKPEPVAEPAAVAEPASGRARTPQVERPRGWRLGLRAKMIFLLFIIPVILIVAAGVLYYRQLTNLSALVTKEGASIVQTLAEQRITELSVSVARQASIYLENHPGLQKTEFNYDMDFKRIAVQKVGMTGYTAVYERPDENGIWRTWAHVNSKIVGINMMDLKKPLGKNFPGFWRVYAGVKGGEMSKGYYRWRDKDGKIREKYMVCTPIQGTRFVVAATTYLDEFTREAKRLEVRAKRRIKETRNIVFAALLVTVILIGIFVSFYGHRLTGKIKSLTTVAERISVGELDAEAEIKSKDELGSLADAIGRMQDSIRLSIDRLRRRR